MAVALRIPPFPKPSALPGFGLRIREGGARMFVVQYKLGTQHRRMTLGSTAQLRLDDARSKARDILAAVRLGRDPAGEKAAMRAGRTTSLAGWTTA